MSEGSAHRALLRFGALATAAVLAFGGTSTALAQDDPTSTPPAPTETVTPPPPSSSEPAPPSSTEPAPPPSTDPAPPPPPPSEIPTQSPATPAAPVEAPKQDEPKLVEKQQVAPDLKISVKFDRTEYALGEPLAITVTVRNEGGAAANQIRFASEPYQLSLTTGVDELVSRPSLKPGESKTIKLGATAPWQADRAGLELRAYVEGSTDLTPNDNVSRDETKIVADTGQVSGVLFEDRNGNGYADPGEGLPWQTLKFAGGPDYPHTFSTSGDGKFSLWKVAVGTYQVRFASIYNGLDRMIKPGQTVVVKKGVLTDVQLQVVPTLSRTLQIAGHSFDKPKYVKGGAISVSVTLRNFGTAPITGLVAVCDPENDPATLDGTGPGWGKLNPDHPEAGITIPVGETKIVTVTDTVPDVDYPTGKVYFACAFSIDGRNVDGSARPMTGGNPGLTVGADVAGTLGVVTGRVLREDNSPVAGGKVVAYNPANNRILDQSGVSWDGTWRIQNLPKGKVALKVIGRWQLADGSPQRIVDVVAEQDVHADLVVKPGPEIKDPTVFAPDLKASVTFDKQTYDISDPVIMTIKIENIGKGISPARGSFNGTPINEEQPYFDGVALWKFLEAPIELWPGESKQITLTGRPRDGGNDPEKLRKLRYLVDVGTQSGDPNYDNNKAEVTANVVWGTGSATVTVYGDLNLNGKLDAGEELANHGVWMGGGKPHVNVDGKTDATGKIRFTDLPAGIHRASDRYDRETGWVPADSGGGQQTLVVNPGDEGTAVIRLVRPLSDKLTASIKFDQPSYEAGAKVRLTVAITNNTEKPVQAKAFCGYYGGSGPYLSNRSADWGKLVVNGPGVAVAVGATTRVLIDTEMPKDSPDYGYVWVSCSFGPEEFGLGNPWVYATTRVPGATETFRGLVVTGQYPNQQPVPNVKVVLLDPDTNHPVARTTTDAEGKWVFPDLAVGMYTPLVVGPWKLRNDWSEGEPFGNVRGADYLSWLWVDPGPEVADPDVAAPAPNPGGGGSTPPVAKVKNKGALANTGVSVLGLVLFGGLLVMAGAAMRRRPSAKQ